MKSNQFSLVLLAGVLAFYSCKKDNSGLKNEIGNNEDSLLRVFQNSKVIKNPIIDLTKKGNSSRLKAGGIVRDSVWQNGLGNTYFVESDNITVSSETEDYAYPGAIFNSKNIISSYQFDPLGREHYDALPIRASLSIPGTNVSGTIEYPSLDETREFVGGILKKNGNVQQINSFSYTSSEFTDYNELKYTFGANVDIGKIVKASVNGGKTKISKRTGVIARFVQENFTLDMSLPKKTELISIADANALQAEYAPTYVSSVTYGRIGIFTAETDANYEDFNVAFKAGVNIGVVGVDTHVTAAQKELLDKAKITIYMKFGPGTAYVQTVEGYAAFKNAILAGANVTSQSYGGPISMRMRNLKNFGIFKSIFKIDVTK